MSHVLMMLWQFEAFGQREAVSIDPVVKNRRAVTTVNDKRHVVVHFPVCRHAFPVCMVDGVLDQFFRLRI